MKIVVIGDEVLPPLRERGCTVVAAVADTHFDSASETWTVTSVAGERVGATIVVDARPSADPVVAVHGVPNYFRLPGPDVARQVRYVGRCLELFERSGAGRIEARGRITVRRRGPQLVAGRFYLSGSEPGPDDLYDGPAVVSVGDEQIAGRVRLIGHLDAVDGRYHWQGMVFGTMPDGVRGRPVTVSVAGRSAPARVADQTPWGTHTVAGVGEPPFAR